MPTANMSSSHHVEEAVKAVIPLESGPILQGCVSRTLNIHIRNVYQ